MRILGIAAKWLFIICLPVLLLTASIGWAVNSLWLYKYGFDKYNVSQTTGLNEANLAFLANELIQYFNSDAHSISITVVKGSKSFELFNEREVAHLRDVKELIWLDYRVLLGTLIYTLCYALVITLWLKDRRHMARRLVGGSGLTLALMLALGLGALLNFDQLFLQFHLISFTNELWQLDPTKDYLIMLFPGGFWYDATLFCALATVTGALILGGAGGAYLLLSRNKTTY